MGLRASKAIAP